MDRLMIVKYLQSNSEMQESIALCQPVTVTLGANLRR